MAALHQPMLLRSIVPLIICTAVTISGCTGSEAENDAEPSTATTLSTPEADRPCAIVTDPPNLPVQELNLQLPVRDVQEEYIQREIQMTRDRGPCNSSPPPHMAKECEPVYGVEDDLHEVILWRNADLVSEYLFAHGASKIVSEGVTGHAAEDGVFRYRALVVSYETEELAENSPIWDMLDGCTSQTSGVARYALSDGADAYLMAEHRDARIIVVETWTGTYEGEAGRIADTSSGRLPTSAVDMIVEWMDQATSGSQAVRS